MNLEIEGLAVTHAGKVRRNNEDNYYLFGIWREDVHVNEQSVRKIGTAERLLAAVYDGMGGEEAGEIAALLAAETFRPCSVEQIETEAKQQVQEANARICAEAGRRGIGQMGTTMAALYLERDTAVSCNIGDSRCYFFRDGNLRQLSVDHSEAQRMIDMGFLNEEEARKNRGWHTLTQHLGISPEELMIEPHFSEPVHMEPGDLFLLCSDGVTDLLMDDEIAEVFQDGKTLESTAEKLVQMALDRGGRDNITLVLLRAERKEPALGLYSAGDRSTKSINSDRSTMAGREGEKMMRRKPMLYAMAAVFLLAVVILAGIIYASRDSVSNQLREQLNLGEKYLTEEEYEQAVVAFTEAISLDDKNVEAYLGLAEAYLGLGDEDAALTTLRNGYAATQNAQILERMEELEGVSVQGDIENAGPEDGTEETEIAFSFALADIQVMGYDLMNNSYDEISAALLASFPSQIIPSWQEGSADTMWHSESDTWDAYTYEADPYRYEATLHEERYLDYTVYSTADYEWLGSLTYDENLSGVMGRGIRLNANLEAADTLVLARDGMLQIPFNLGITEEELREILKISEIEEKGVFAQDMGTYIFLDSSLGKGTLREEVMNEDGRGTGYSLDLYPDTGGTYHIFAETNGDGRVYEVQVSYDPEEAYFYVPEELQED